MTRAFRPSAEAGPSQEEAHAAADDNQNVGDLGARDVASDQEDGVQSESVADGAAAGGGSDGVIGDPAEDPERGRPDERVDDRVGEAGKWGADLAEGAQSLYRTDAAVPADRYPVADGADSNDLVGPALLGVVAAKWLGDKWRNRRGGS